MFSGLEVVSQVCNKLRDDLSIPIFPIVSTQTQNQIIVLIKSNEHGITDINRAELWFKIEYQLRNGTIQLTNIKNIIKEIEEGLQQYISENLVFIEPISFIEPIIDPDKTDYSITVLRYAIRSIKTI